MPRKEKMTKRKEHRSMMVGMLIYILILTILCVTVGALEDGEFIDAVSLLDDEEFEQDATLLKPKTAVKTGSSGKAAKSGSSKSAA